MADDRKTSIVGQPVSIGATSQATAASVAGTASTTLVMAGLGVTHVPVHSGTVEVTISGDMTQTTTADGGAIQISYGTGSAPAQGAALAGTQVGNLPTMTFLTGVLTVPFSVNAIITGLTVGTTYWFDLAYKAITGGSLSLSNLSVSIGEY